MNLSSYLQMPPAPPVPQSLSTSATQGLAAGVRADAGTNAGQDFANIMARQFQRLSASERPSFAAETPPRPEISAQADQTQRAQWANGQSYATQQRLNDDRQQATSRDAQTNQAVAQRQDRANDASKNDADKSNTETTDAEKSADEKRAEQRAQQLRDAASAKALNAADATLLAQVAMMAMPPASPTQGTATPPAEASLSLRTIALSPQVHIITTPSATPNAESLTAFAKSMGLDEAAIQKLLGEGAANPAAPAMLSGQANPAADAALAMTNNAALPAVSAGLATATLPSGSGLPLSQTASAAASAQAADPLMQALNAAVAGMPASSASATQATATPALPAATQADSAASQLAALGLLPETAATMATTAIATPASTSQAPVQLGLSAAEMASIQQIQITIAAPVTAPVASLQAMATSGNGASIGTSLSTSASTPDALSLLGGNVTEQSISDLVAQFSHNATGGDDAQQQPSSGNSGGQGFAQALAQTSAPTPTTNANAASQVATTTPMSEVYDQLSDKMATEMAARMHKQLSDGEWKMKFGLRPAHLGGVEIQLEMKDGKLNAVFQAENPLTRDLLQNSSQRLRDALENFGIHAGQMHIGQDSGNAQQNPSRGSSKPSQVGDNSSLQVKGSDNVASATETRNKANASLLDLYA
jgi:flagellar hook-length control protein FliK